MAAQGLSCARIIALSLSLVLGKVSKLSSCMSLKYGEDPALSEPAKQARKAGKKTIATVIKAKDYSGAGAFFSALMQSYAADGMIEEASLVAAWWAETYLWGRGRSASAWSAGGVHRTSCGTDTSQLH